MSQVISNLVLNAIQAMPEGGVIELFTRQVFLETDEKPSLGAGEYIEIAGF